MLELILLAKAVATPAPLPVTPAPAVADACATLIPPSLAVKLRSAEPTLDLPQAAEAGAARLQIIARTGGWPCPFIALGDFDGNGWLDRALLLRNPAPTAGAAEGRLIAALNTEGEWQIKAIENWGPPLAESYVQIMEPGLYQRSDAASKPAAELDLLQTIQSDAPGFAAGKFNGRFAAYFLQDNDWRRVWLRD